MGCSQLIDDLDCGIVRRLNAEHHLHGARIILGAECFEVFPKPGLCPAERLHESHRRTLRRDQAGRFEEPLRNANGNEPINRTDKRGSHENPTRGDNKRRHNVEARGAILPDPGRAGSRKKDGQSWPPFLEFLRGPTTTGNHLGKSMWEEWADHLPAPFSYSTWTE